MIKYFEEKYYKKVRNGKRYRLAMNMKPFVTIFGLKKVNNKNSEINNVTSPTAFLGEHGGNIYTKKINMNHLSPRTHLNLYIFE